MADLVIFRQDYLKNWQDKNPEIPAGQLCLVSTQQPGDQPLKYDYCVLGDGRRFNEIDRINIKVALGSFKGVQSTRGQAEDVAMSQKTVTDLLDAGYICAGITEPGTDLLTPSPTADQFWFVTKPGDYIQDGKTMTMKNNGLSIIFHTVENNNWSIENILDKDSIVDFDGFIYLKLYNAKTTESGGKICYSQVSKKFGYYVRGKGFYADWDVNGVNKKELYYDSNGNLKKNVIYTSNGQLYTVNNSLELEVLSLKDNYLVEKNTLFIDGIVGEIKEGDTIYYNATSSSGNFSFLNSELVDISKFPVSKDKAVIPEGAKYIKANGEINVNFMFTNATISPMFKRLSKVEEDVEILKGLDNYYVNKLTEFSSGNIITNNIVGSTLFIKASSPNNGLFSFFNAEGTLISTFKASTTSISIPKTAKGIKVRSGNISIEYMYSDANINETYLETKNNKASLGLQSISDIILEWVPNNYISNTGEITPASSSYGYSQFISLEKGYALSIKVNANSSIAAISKKEGSLYIPLVIGKEQKFKDYFYIAKEKEDICISSYNYKESSAILIKSNLISCIENELSLKLNSPLTQGVLGNFLAWGENNLPEWKNIVVPSDDSKLDKPSNAGSAGNILSLNSEGKTIWASSSIDSAVIKKAVEDYINANPELITNISEHSISYNKLNNDLSRKIRNSSSPVRRPFISFTADDGYKEDITVLAPIMKRQGAPCCLALESGMLSDINERLDLQNNHNWEMMCHSTNPTPFDKLTREEIENALITSKKELEDKGFIINGFVFPSGTTADSSGNNVKDIVKKYFVYGLLFSGRKEYRINSGLTDSYSIHRVPLGAVFTLQGQGTLEYYKECIDDCIAKNGWLIFAMHTQANDFPQEQQQFLEQTIIYAKSKGIEIGTVSEGYEIFGNSIELGNTQQGNGKESAEEDMKRFIVTNTGETNLPIFLTRHLTVKNDTVLEYFPQNKISVSQIFNYNAGFPTGKGGILLTYRFDNYAFQMWNPVSENSLYRRVYKENSKSWGVWKLISKSSYSDSIIQKNVRINQKGTVVAEFPMSTYLIINRLFIGVNWEEELVITKRRINLYDFGGNAKVNIGQTSTGAPIELSYDNNLLSVTSTEDLGNCYIMFNYN